MQINLKKCLVILIIYPIASLAWAQTFNDPLSYLQYVGSQFEEISKDMMSYTSAASHGKSARKVEKKRQELMLTVKTAETNMRRLTPYKGDHAFRDSVIAYFQINGIVLREEYGKIVNMEEVAEQSYDLMEAYLLAKEKANDKLDEAYTKVSNQQKAFAEKNNIKLVEGKSKLSEKLETAAKVSQYYNTIYLIFFKSYKDEVYLLNAVDKMDVNSIEQSKNSLNKNATDGMKTLMKISSFANDATLKNACMKNLEFYNSESIRVPGLIDFQLKKENFEKIKKAFDLKRQSDRTQQDIDEYNKAIGDFNSAVNKFNVLNNELNKSRSTALNLWNKTSDEFLDNHTPKYR